MASELIHESNILVDMTVLCILSSYMVTKFKNKFNSNFDSNIMSPFTDKMIENK